MLNAKKLPRNNVDRPDPLDEGTYPVRLVQVISLGLQKQRPFMGEEKLPAYELWLTYECLDEFMKDEDGDDDTTKPRWLSERIPFYSLDSDRAKSTKRYLALDPQIEFDGDWTKLVGAPAMMTIVAKPSKKDEKVIYNNITNLAPMRDKDAARAPGLVNDPVVFDLEEPDLDVFDKLPEFLQTIIRENLEYAGSTLEAALKARSKSKGGDTKKAEKAPQRAAEEVSDDDDDDWGDDE